MILVEQDVLMPSPGKVIAYDQKNHIQVFPESIPAEKVTSGRFKNKGYYRYLLFSRSKRTLTGVKFNNAALLKLYNLISAKMGDSFGDLPVYSSAQAIVDKGDIFNYIAWIDLDNRGLSIYVHDAPIEGNPGNGFRINTSLCVYLAISRIKQNTSTMKDKHSYVNIKPHNIGDEVGDFCFKQLKVKK